MPVLVAVCLVLITLGLWVLIAIIAAAALQFRRTAEAVEVSVYRFDDGMAKLRGAGDAVSEFAGTLGSGWMKALGLALAAGTTYWAAKSRTRDTGAAQ